MAFSSDNVAQLVLDRDNKGNWFGILFIVAVFILGGYAIWKTFDAFHARTTALKHQQELQITVDRSNENKKRADKNQELLDKSKADALASQNWANDQINKQQKLLDQERTKNANLQKLLDARYPSSLHQ